jgi:hypothetical protein
VIGADRSDPQQNYRGLPRGSPSTSPYFSLPPHAKNKDAYSICFRFRLKEDINGNDLVFGNDFDHPIRDRLPPGFGTAFKIVKWGMTFLLFYWDCVGLLQLQNEMRESEKGELC